MRNVYLLLFFLAPLLVPSSVAAQSCYWYTCDYITDGYFDYGGQHWYSMYSTFNSYTDTCLTFQPQNPMVQIDNEGYIEQTFYVNSGFPRYSLEFNAYILDDTENWWDRLAVTVVNHTTNQSENFYYHGNDFDFTCPRLSIPLGNYDNSWVTVRFQVSWLNAARWRLDNVSFYGHYYP